MSAGSTRRLTRLSGPHGLGRVTGPAKGLPVRHIEGRTAVLQFHDVVSKQAFARPPASRTLTATRRTAYHRRPPSLMIFRLIVRIDSLGRDGNARRRRTQPCAHGFKTHHQPRKRRKARRQCRGPFLSTKRGRTTRRADGQAFFVPCQAALCAFISQGRNRTPDATTRCSDSRQSCRDRRCTAAAQITQLSRARASPSGHSPVSTTP